MFWKFIVGTGLVVALVCAGMATNVQAQLKQALFSTTKTQPINNKALKIIDCEDGAAALKGAGFAHVFAIDCSGAQYSYNGFRKSVEHTIVFNAHSGGMMAVAR